MFRLLAFTHPSATERQTLSYDVDAEYPEDLLRWQRLLGDFLRRQRLLGHLLGISQLQCLALQRSLGCLFLAGGLWHFSPRAGWWETGNRAMPQHCQPRVNGSYPDRSEMWDLGQLLQSRQEGVLTFKETAWLRESTVSLLSWPAAPFKISEGLMSWASLLGRAAAVLVRADPHPGTQTHMVEWPK